MPPISSHSQIGSYLEREDPRDALCGATELRSGMRIGTASIRRRAQLLAAEPTLSIEPLRGNIDTRLRKRGERGLREISEEIGNISPATL